MSPRGNILARVGERLTRHTPVDNLRLLRRKAAGVPVNTLRPGVMGDVPAAIEFLRGRASSLGEPVLLVGEGAEANLLARALDASGTSHLLLEPWAGLSGKEMAAAIGRIGGGMGLASDATVVICPWPSSAGDWEKIHHLRGSLPHRVVTFQEMLLPMTLLSESKRLLPYRYETLEEMLPFYTGRGFLGPIDELDQACPFAGKRVIEFGPMDGYQTASLVNLGAKDVTCIEARAENALKTLAATAAFGWTNVRVVMDDFHNVSSANYGRFDLAFAHGVYYHSFAPEIFFQNLFSLADHIFFGGFVADLGDPDLEYVSLGCNGHTYTVAEHGDGFGWDQGVNPKSYYFQEDDLVSLFQDNGFRVTPLADYQQTPTLSSVRYLRFLASRGSSPA